MLTLGRGRFLCQSVSVAKIKFGTDGWRAVIAEDFTFANVARVAQASADYWSAECGTRNAEWKGRNSALRTPHSAF